MVSLAALWLPIVISAVIVFVVSAAVWMAMPHHKKDFTPISAEDSVMDALRPHVSAGTMYYFPFFHTGAEANSAEYKEKVAKGPVGILRVRTPESVLSMGPALFKSIVLYLVVGLFVAYMGTLALPAGSDYMQVFQVTGTAAFLAYGFVGFQESIWFGLPGSVAFKHALDGLLYAVLTAGVFGWLWPA
ncbi:MAG: hypothetical protein ACR2QM_04100 [Longimicrobiales bacterium]